ncbi:hypothetical protein HMI55_005874 [Coelomomyces lativittatus]|nr:hypothetical protein HMI55_005874 [Coelomomyces lativittatus]
MEEPRDYINIFQPHMNLISGELEQKVIQFLSEDQDFDNCIAEAKNLRELSINGLLCAYPYFVSSP